MPAPKKRTLGDRIDIMIPDSPKWRFQKSVGDVDRHEANARRALLRRLIEMGQLGVVKALFENRTTWEALRQASRDNRLGNDDLGAELLLVKPLWNDAAPDQGAFARTLLSMGKPGAAGEQTRKRYACVFDQLRGYGARAGLSGTSTVRDLATANWPALWAAMGDLSPASRNHVRSALSAFLSKFLNSKHHPFRHKVCQALGPDEDATVAPRDITKEEWPIFMAALDEAVRPSALILAFTGMRIAEYLQLDEKDLGKLPFLYIPGYRLPVSVPEGYEYIARQAIPCRLAPAPAVMVPYPGVQFDARYHKIYDAFKAASKATGIPCTPHYLRHLFAQVGTDEKSQVAVQHAMRHKTEGMTGHYAKRKSTQDVSNAVGAVLGEAAGVAPVLAEPPLPALVTKILSPVERRAAAKRTKRA